MEEFFFAPIKQIITTPKESSSTWETISDKRHLTISQIKVNLMGKVFNCSIELKEYLLLFCDQNHIIDLRNLYVHKIKPGSIKLIQKEFVCELNFKNKSRFNDFMEVAKRYVIRTDMEKVYKFNLENNHDRVGSGGFGDVRLIQNRKTKATFALKSVYKKKVKNKRSSANSMRYV